MYRSSTGYLACKELNQTQSVYLVTNQPFILREWTGEPQCRRRNNTMPHLSTVFMKIYHKDMNAGKQCSG